MPFKKVNPKEEIEKRKKVDPEFAKEMEKLEKEWEDIKSGKLDKKFGQD